jgi:hypothetical protein
MSNEIKVLTLGIASTHCYILADTETSEALVIDPVDEAARNYCRSVTTHGYCPVIWN